MRLHYLPLIAFSLFTSTAFADQLMQWKRIPLEIDLHVGQERIIFVDRNVAVGIPPELDGKIQVQSSGGAVYLKSKTSFKLHRVQLRDLESGVDILLDVRSKKSKEALDNVRIVLDPTTTVTNNAQNIPQTAVSDEPTVSTTKSALPAPAALVRYAAQSLYAPLRTVEPLQGVHRVALKLPKTVSNLLPHLSILATPLEAWGLEGYVVTAVRIKNLANQRVELDPRYLQGYFYAAAFQHNWLGEKGTMEDTTVVYLVTEGKPERAFISAQAVKKSVKNTKAKQK